MQLFKRRKGRFFLTLKGKEVIAGYCFLIPFLAGLLFLFIPMVFKSLQFSLSNLEVSSSGFRLSQAGKNGFEHYIRALAIDPDFNLMLLKAVGNMLTNVPLIIIFSFFTANLLNQRFKGRAVARSIFFFPVILTSGAILGLEVSDLLVSAGTPAVSSENIATVVNIAGFLFKYTELPINLILLLANAVNGIYTIVISSGVQILIFLAGLQSISPSLYEASNMEGATSWENFWKITFPMISPLILVNSVYTIIDSFTSEMNDMMQEIQRVIFINVEYGLGSAMAWIYFICIALLLLGAGLLLSGKIFYYDER